MDKKVPDGQFTGDKRVPHLKPGEIFDDRRIPGDFPFFNQETQCRCREDLGVRGDPEKGLTIHGRRFAQPADAKALGDHDPAVLDDGQADSRNLECFHHPRNRGVEFRRRLDGFPGCGLGTRQQRGCQKSQRYKNCPSELLS